MTYEETVEYLYNSTPMFQSIGAAAYKEGLETTLLLDEHFGHPHKSYKTIHVAGTNGKGSCSHTLAAILQSQGYKVGLFTSPHLLSFRERIKVNGVEISKERVVEFVERERCFFEPLHPSFFELTTALALKYFEEEKVDIAVIEVGLGGRLDCTNIITPILSIITNISYDHTQFLGSTLEEIAAEKAGIMKHNVPVLIGECSDKLRLVFQEKAREHGAKLYFAEDNCIIQDVCMTDNMLRYGTKRYATLLGELIGTYQIKNTNTILNAVEILANSIEISEKSVRNGVGNVSKLTGLLGRWQKIQEMPLVICDTGHNIGGWEYISEQIKAQECRTLRIIFGMVDDKDIDSVMALLPTNAVYYFTKASTKRAVNEIAIQEKGASHGLLGKAYPSVIDAYRAAITDADKEDFVFVGGSSYIVSDFLEHCLQLHKD